MTDREAKLQEIKLILLNNLKKKVEKIEDNTEEKEGSSNEEKNKEKGSSDSYGILKSDSDKGN